MSTGFTFQGDYRRRTQINLGGHKREDRATLLRKAQEERRAREEKRRNDLAAMKIQAFWRGRRHLASEKDVLRHEWDELVGADDVTETAWFRATRLMRFFYDARIDGGRAAILLAWLTQSKSVVDKWLSTKPNFEWVLMGLMASFLKSVGSLGELADTFDVMMVQFMGQHTSLLNHLVPPPHNLFATLANLTIKMHHSVPQLVALTLLPLRDSSYQNQDPKLQNYQYFVSQWLGTGNVMSTIGSSESTPLSKSLSPSLLITAIYSVTSQDLVSPISQLWLLGHFLLIVELSGRKQEYLNHPEYVRTIATLLRNSTKVSGFLNVRWSSLGTVTEDDEEDEDDEEQDGEDVIMKEDVPQRDINSFAPFDPQIQSLISNLVTRRQIAAIVASATNDTAADVANCLIAILQAFPTKRDEILMDLILIITTDNQDERKDIIGVLWARVKTGQLFQAGKSRKIELTQLYNSTYDADWPALVVLVYLYSRLLMTMIDDEFFDQRKSLINLDDVRVLSKFLSHIVFSMWWTDKKFDQTRSMGDTGVTFKQFRSIVTQCLIKIYLRDSRKPFLPEGHWLMMSESASTFISAVQSEEEEKEDDNESVQLNRHGIRAETRLYKRVVGRANFTTPRLNILRNVPFFIPFETRVQIFRAFIDRDRAKYASSRFSFFPEDQPQTSISRDHIVDDAFDNLHGMSKKGWKSPLHIQLVDKFGLPEAGIDGGGLTKEFLSSACKEAFDPKAGLFKETPERLLYPSPNRKDPVDLDLYEFLGKVVGKCLYENVLVDVEFAPFFLLRWFGRHAYLDDLPSLDKQIYRSLVSLKQYIGDFDDLAISFVLPRTEEDEGPEIELITNGRNIPVTYQNRLQYIHLVANYRLNVMMQKQATAFVRGLSTLIDVKWLVMFNQKELQTLVGGAEGKPIDVEELRKCTVLGGYDNHDKTVRLFWEVMKEMKEADKRKVLKFVTSVERPPLLGFKELLPQFSIRNAGSDTTRLPTASTCVNLLKLPDYKDKETLREKLFYAINAGAGFDLS